ncbi:glycerol-3-phosphate dehydrogenase, putative [Ixodes scapularis]|uniref:glycerol-3-phosphate dehydrogenase n=1 Tax=Ixodes scapularis TaxID=6945 RepID=B7QEA1_IXOSC|nr:glycerol-3-phosphate dehydrogenase, putative [Ixodes scapularis]|eukprot:XP_002413865.1 glycerol-3-phosphate dehydrogenase, putative [Ixodes scapularis]
MLLALPHRGQTLVNGLHKRLDSLLDTLPSTETVTKLLCDWNEQLDSNTASTRLCEVSQSGLVSTTGGTWTWYRLMAERAVDAAMASCDDKLSALPCSTKNMRLGMFADACKGARSLNPGESLLPRLPYIEAEASVHPPSDRVVRHAVRHEYACTAVEVLARRLGVAFEDAHAAECMLPRVADIMALELGWSSS